MARAQVDPVIGCITMATSGVGLAADPVALGRRVVEILEVGPARASNIVGVQMTWAKIIGRGTAEQSGASKPRDGRRRTRSESGRGIRPR